MFGIDTVPKNEYRLKIYEEAKELYPNNSRDKPCILINILISDLYYIVMTEQLWVPQLNAENLS
jgi:hypothetical protein